MNFTGFIGHLLGGLASASSLFLVGAGLSLIFGVTRVVNFAHGSFYMLGLYLAYSLTEYLGSGWGFWFSILLATVAVGVIGALLELSILRRVYAAPELFQLLATFAIALVLKDLALWYWGPEDLLGPRAYGLSQAVIWNEQRLPSYDFFLILIGPLVLLALWLLLNKTRWGMLVRAATQDREILGALGVNQVGLFTSVFALGAALAGLGGALQLPREPANLGLDMVVIGEAFVVVVVGGMGSISGAFVAALLIALLKAFCIAMGNIEIFGISFALPKLSLVLEFLVMAFVLILRPWGLLGKPLSLSRNSNPQERPYRSFRPTSRVIVMVLVLALIFLPQLSTDSPYNLVLAIDLLTATLFASSLFLLMGPSGMNSFGHSAFFGCGAYMAALLLTRYHFSMEASLFLSPLVAAVLAAAVAWFSIRLSGVYLAMLTLAFAQILWSLVFQWDDVTGGSNGLTGVWPAQWTTLHNGFYYLCLVLVVVSLWCLRTIALSPMGFALKASRDSLQRASAIGIPSPILQILAFAIAGGFAGLAGALFAFSKGSISPDSLGVHRSIDGLVMVLLGGVQNLLGPWVGAITYTWLQDWVIRNTAYWRALLGSIMLILVLVFPMGIAGSLQLWWEKLKPILVKKT